MFEEIGKGFIFFGLVLVVLGLVLVLVPSFELGRFPGDIWIRKDTWSIYIPITSGIFLSIVLSLLLWIVTFLRR